METVQKHAGYALELPDLNAVWELVYQRDYDAELDVDQDLYNGFIGNNDRRLLQNLITYNGEKLARAAPQFQDARLDELLFRYRARNFPDTLTETEIERWDQLRAERFFEGSASALTLDDYFAQIDKLGEDASERDQEILGALYDYAEQIVPDQN
jgi:exodeoxyribonuclease-1